MDALRALSALGPALPEVPNAPLEGLLQALVGRLSDGNAKVNQKALEVSAAVATAHVGQPWTTATDHRRALSRQLLSHPCKL